MAVGKTVPNAVKKKKTMDKQLTNEQLLTLLGERIAEQNGDEEVKRAYYKNDDEIDDNFFKGTWDRGFPYLGIWDKKTGKRIIRVCLSTGKIEK